MPRVKRAAGAQLSVAHRRQQRPASASERPSWASSPSLPPAPCPPSRPLGRTTIRSSVLRALSVTSNRRANGPNAQNSVRRGQCRLSETAHEAVKPPLPPRNPPSSATAHFWEARHPPNQAPRDRQPTCVGASEPGTVVRAAEYRAPAVVRRCVGGRLCGTGPRFAQRTRQHNRRLTGNRIPPGVTPAASALPCTPWCRGRWTQLALAPTAVARNDDLLSAVAEEDRMSVPDHQPRSGLSRQRNRCGRSRRSWLRI
jgi:hypothetical protein